MTTLESKAESFLRRYNAFRGEQWGEGEALVRLEQALTDVDLADFRDKWKQIVRRHERKVN